MLDTLLVLHNPIWQWFFAAGIFLMLLELCLPAFFLLWVGVACFLTAGTLLVCALDSTGQALVFSGYCIFSLVAGYAFYQRNSVSLITSGLNNREDQLIGTVFMLGSPLYVSNNDSYNKNYVTLNDTRWVIQSANEVDLDAKTKVRVVAIKGNILLVSQLHC
ncbi:MAG: NfeD family protein [Candidatus Paracaedibacteraceae bacterium]|nr:NfeD family protein [Candidatus Paracaedibacteraceae bacterium]